MQILPGMQVLLGCRSCLWDADPAGMQTSAGMQVLLYWDAGPTSGMQTLLGCRSLLGCRPLVLRGCSARGVPLDQRALASLVVRPTRSKAKHVCE